MRYGPKKHHRRSIRLKGYDYLQAQPCARYNLDYLGAIHESPLQDVQKHRPRSLLSKIIGYFKMNIAKQINILRATPGIPLWQRNYYEHIIRTEDELNRIREYLQSNPLRWELDRENSNRTNMDESDQWLYGG